MKLADIQPGGRYLVRFPAESAPSWEFRAPVVVEVIEVGIHYDTPKRTRMSVGTRRRNGRQAATTVSTGLRQSKRADGVLVRSGDITATVPCRSVLRKATETEVVR